MKKMIVVAAGICFCAATFIYGRAAGSSAPAPERSFEFTYEVRVPAPAAGAGAVRVWIPVPISSAYQEISDLKIESPVPFTRTRDA